MRERHDFDGWVFNQDAVNEARELLGEALWDDEPWEGERLVELMERVYEKLGGDLGEPPSS